MCFKWRSKDEFSIDQRQTDSLYFVCVCVERTHSNAEQSEWAIGIGSVLDSAPHWCRPPIPLALLVYRLVPASFDSAHSAACRLLCLCFPFICCQFFCGAPQQQLTQEPPRSQCSAKQRLVSHSRDSSHHHQTPISSAAVTVCVCVCVCNQIHNFLPLPPAVSKN